MAKKVYKKTLKGIKYNKKKDDILYESKKGELSPAGLISGTAY